MREDSFLYFISHPLLLEYLSFLTFLRFSNRLRRGLSSEGSLKTLTQELRFMSLKHIFYWASIFWFSLSGISCSCSSATKSWFSKSIYLVWFYPFHYWSGIPFSSNPPFFLAYSIRSSTWLTHTPFSNILRYFSGFGWTGNLLSTFQRLSTRVRSPIVFPDFALKVSHFLSWFSFSFGVILLQLILKPMFRFRGMSFLPLFHLFVYFTISKSSLHTPPVLLPPPWVVE